MTERAAIAQTTSGRRGGALRFLLPSLAGAFAFFCPVPYGGGTTIPLDALTKWLGALLGSAAPTVVCAVCIVSALATLVFSFTPFGVSRYGRHAPGRVRALFTTTPGWAALRVAGGVAAAAWVWGLGPAWLVADPIAKTALDTVGVPVLLVFLTSCFFLPLITDYGLMEFCGVLSRPFFQRVFQLPGRASLDALASWVSSGPVAVLITLRQFDAGYYTAREALTIICNFSVVSVPFSLVIAQVAGMREHYLAWYASLVVIGLACALVTPRLWPLRSLPDEYVGRAAATDVSRADASRREDAPVSWREAVAAATATAATARGPRAYLADALAVAFDTVFGLVAACVGTVVLANLVLEYTPVFDWLARPFVPVLVALGLGDADAAAPGLLVGFLDQFLTALVATRVSDAHTQFVLAGLSVVQIVYLSNFGVILLRSALPVRLGTLLGIFVVRTAIALPMLTLAAHLVLGSE